MRINANDTITFLPQWRDKGDESIAFKAIADQDSSGRLDVVACLGLTFNPIQTVTTSMIETVNGQPFQS